MHLTHKERGVYLYLLMWMAENDFKIINDDSHIARLTGLKLKTWQNMKPTIMKFFGDDGTVIYSPALVEQAKNKFEKSAKAGV